VTPPSDQVFKVVLGSTPLPTTARSIRVALFAGSFGYGEFDDVNVSYVY
jgi:hypothetical protein